MKFKMRSGCQEAGNFQNCVELLRQSGFYWGPITNHQAKIFLQNSKAGSFLIRDSADQRYLFTISLKTSTKVTNVRIVMQKSKFRLDSGNSGVRIPSFNSILWLIDYYMQIAWQIKSYNATQERLTKDANFLLYYPLYKELPPLKHLCRRAINQNTASPESVYTLPISHGLQKYLRQWPYSC